VLGHRAAVACLLVEQLGGQAVEQPPGDLRRFGNAFRFAEGQEHVSQGIAVGAVHGARRKAASTAGREVVIHQLPEGDVAEGPGTTRRSAILVETRLLSKIVCNPAPMEQLLRAGETRFAATAGKEPSDGRCC